MDLYGEMGCTNRGDFISQASERPKTFRFFSEALFATNATPEKNSTNGLGDGGEKIKTRIKRSMFCHFFADWALLLKIQTAITSSMLEVRGSSLDSREISATPFNYVPLVT